MQAVITHIRLETRDLIIKVTLVEISIPTELLEKMKILLILIGVRKNKSKTFHLKSLWS